MNKSLPLSSTLRFLIGFASLAIALVFMRFAAPLLNPLILALIIVLNVTPILYGLRRRRVPGWLAFIITLAVVIVVFLGLILLIVGALNQFMTALPTYITEIENGNAAVEDFLATLGFEKLELDTKAIVSVLDLSSLLEFGAEFLAGLVKTLSDFILIMLIITFLLVDALGIPAKTTNLQESGNEMFVRLKQFAIDIRRYVGITTVVGLATGILDTIIFILVGVDFAILWGILAFLMSYIPTIGFWLALIPPVILALLEFGLPTAVLVFIGIVLINGFAENVVKPKYMGEGLNLSIFVVIFSVIFWAAVLGPIGAILAVPITMAFKTLVLEPDENNRWLVELMSSRKDQKTTELIKKTAPEGAED